MQLYTSIISKNIITSKIIVPFTAGLFKAEFTRGMKNVLYLKEVLKKMASFGAGQFYQLCAGVGEGPEGDMLVWSWFVQ